MLKAHLIVSVLFLLAFGRISGQTNKIDLGIVGGPYLISLRGNDIIEKYQEPTIGFSAGVTFQYNFKKLISLRTDIAFERKGSVWEGETTDENGNSLGEITTHSNFDYLTLPLLIRLSLGKKIIYFINTGPYFGFLIKQTSVTRGDEIRTLTNDNTSDFNRFDIGISVGLGLSIPISKQFLVSFEIRDDLGLYNVSKSPVINNGTIKTNSAGMILGFAYRFGISNQE
jgi:hypothetical protein